MKIRLVLLISIAVIGMPLYAATQPLHDSPVVVELFTSEGCSDCPPADDLLNGMVQHPPAGLTIIPMAFHVTYWDNQAWRDRFSDMRYTQRQAAYERDFHVQSPYTPQSVIDGRYQAVGNDASSVSALIRRAAQDSQPVAVTVSAQGNSVIVGARTADGSVTGKVLLAITEDGLSTEVRGGENNSRTLHHDAVVRSFEQIGALDHGEFNRTINVRPKRDWRGHPLHAVVFVQDDSGRVLGAATVAF